MSSVNAFLKKNFRKTLKEQKTSYFHIHRLVLRQFFFKGSDRES